jgi:hypothetical protein
MALVEVDQTEWEALQNELKSTRPHKAILDTLGKNPKTRRQVLGLLKEAAPQLSIPEIDAAAPIMDEVQKANQRVADLEKKLSEKDAEETKAKQTQKLESEFEEGKKYLRKNGVQDETIPAVIEFMTKRGLVDFEAGLALWEKSQPTDSAIDPINTSRSWDMFIPNEGDDDVLKAAVSLPKGPAQRQALQRWQNKEIAKWRAETGNIQRMRARA